LGSVVLLVGIKEDIHLTVVENFLSDLPQAVIRFDPTCDAELPFFYSLEGESSYFQWPDGKIVYLTDITSVFCRFALETLAVSEEITGVPRYAASEHLENILSGLKQIPSKKWINDPWLESKYDSKIYQREIAKGVGIRVPKQVVTNNIEHVRKVFSSEEPLIIKPLSDTSIGKVGGKFYCDQPIPSDDFSAPYTASFDAWNVPAQHDSTPFLVQSKLDKKFDVRAMIVDGEVYAYSVNTTDDKIDFRVNEIQNVIPFEFPNDDREKLTALMSKMRMRFACCDYVLNQDDELIFLEANLSGNWLFCDRYFDFAVSKRTAEILSQCVE